MSCGGAARLLCYGVLRQRRIGFIALQFLALTVLILSSNVASAEPLAEPPEAEQLMAQLQDDFERLDTSNCSAACDAVTSMNRAAERICELEPGPRCEQARQRVERAREKVRAACPECDVAKKKSATTTDGAGSEQPSPPPPRDLLREEDGHKDAPVEPEAVVNKAAPSDGGCASCAVGQDSGSNTSHGWLALALLLWARRRRRP